MEITPWVKDAAPEVGAQSAAFNAAPAKAAMDAVRRTVIVGAPRDGQGWPSRARESSRCAAKSTRSVAAAKIEQRPSRGSAEGQSRAPATKPFDLGPDVGKALADMLLAGRERRQCGDSLSRDPFGGGIAAMDGEPERNDPFGIVDVGELNFRRLAHDIQSSWLRATPDRKGRYRHQE
jgi:hypothetical protein